MAGYGGLLAAIAEQNILFRIAGRVVGALSILGQFHPGLHPHAFAVFVDV